MFRPPCWLRWRKKRAAWEGRMTRKRFRIFRPLLDGRFSCGPACRVPRRTPKPCRSGSSAFSCGTSSGSPGPFPPTPLSSERRTGWLNGTTALENKRTAMVSPAVLIELKRFTCNHGKRLFLDRPSRRRLFWGSHHLCSDVKMVLYLLGFHTC